jgi:hypothetical protein
MQRAQERLYLNADKSKIVAEGDPKAAFLYAALGDEIPDSAASKFGLVDGRLKGKGSRSSTVVTLLGSSILASVVAITDTVSVQLGNIVKRAHDESKLTAEAWNELPESDREKRLADVVEVMKAEAAAPPPPSTTKPETSPTPKPETTPVKKPETAPAKKAQAKRTSKKKAA